MQTKARSNTAQMSFVSIDRAISDVYRIVDADHCVMSEEDILESATAAADHLSNYKMMETAICLRAVNNFHAELPTYHSITGVLWRDELDDNDDLTQSIETTITTLAEEGVSQVTTQQVYTLKADAASRGWHVALPGHSIPTMMHIDYPDISDGDCCRVTYSIDHSSERLLQMSKSSGCVIIIYTRQISDSKGKRLVPNVPSVMEAIKAYVIAEIQMKESLAHREGSISLLDRWDEKWVNWSRQAAGQLMMLTYPEWVSLIAEGTRLINNEDPYRLIDEHYGPEHLNLGTGATQYRY